MNLNNLCGLFIVWLMASTAIANSEALTPEPSPDAYSFVTHYRIPIDAPKAQVWPYLVDLKAWMYEFELSPISGHPAQEGQILRLYTGQDFKIQITKVIPNEMLAISNLPMTFKDEHVTGVGVMTLHDKGDGTEVSLTMSRRYTWKGEGENPLRATRNSEDFHAQTKAMWQSRFLARLKCLAEGHTCDE